MEIQTHILNHVKVAEILAPDVVIKTAEDGLNLVGNLYYQDYGKAIIYQKNLTPDFFKLSTGIAGEVLQKFTNYRVQLAIVGDFSGYPGKSITDFIYESNKGRQVNFVGSLPEALKVLTTS